MSTYLLIESIVKEGNDFEQGCTQCAAETKLAMIQRAPLVDQGDGLRLKTREVICQIVLLLPHECGKDQLQGEPKWSKTKTP